MLQDYKETCNSDKGYDIPVVFLLSNLFIIVEQVQLNMQFEIRVIVIVLKPCIAVFYQEIVLMVILSVKKERRCGFRPICSNIVESDRSFNGSFAPFLLLSSPLFLINTYQINLFTFSLGLTCRVCCERSLSYPRCESHLIYVYPSLVLGDFSEPDDCLVIPLSCEDKQKGSYEELDV